MTASRISSCTIKAAGCEILCATSACLVIGHRMLLSACSCWESPGYATARNGRTFFWHKSQIAIRKSKIEAGAEGVRFELTRPFGLPVFKTGAINRSATPPNKYYILIIKYLYYLLRSHFVYLSTHLSILMDGWA